MILEVRVFGGLEKSIPGATFGKPLAVEAPEGVNTRGLLKMLNIPEEQVFTILVNGIHSGMDRPLKAGDRVSFFPPVGGG